MYLSNKEIAKLNNDLNTDDKRKFLDCICSASDGDCYFCSINNECEEACNQTSPSVCSDYQVHKLFEKVLA